MESTSISNLGGFLIGLFDGVVKLLIPFYVTSFDDNLSSYLLLVPSFYPNAVNLSMLGGGSILTLTYSLVSSAAGGDLYS
jgi:hypothetical protein